MLLQFVTCQRTPHAEIRKSVAAIDTRLAGFASATKRALQLASPCSELRSCLPFLTCCALVRAILWSTGRKEKGPLMPARPADIRRIVIVRRGSFFSTAGARAQRRMYVFVGLQTRANRRAHGATSPMP